MIGHARCRPGGRTGFFAGRSAICAGASRDLCAGAGAEAKWGAMTVFGGGTLASLAVAS